MSGPLAGLLVVSLEQAVAAPFATRQLADWGARVVKVERPGGDFARRYDETVRGMSSYFVWLNRGKESVELDLKAPEGRATLEALLGRADVFVHNLAPGAVDRLGFDANTLAARNPGLVDVAITGYGETGPYASKKAYDLLIQCEAGFLDVTGIGDEPVKAGISIADIAAGMYAYTGALTALLTRTATGRGDVVRVSMLDALGEWMSQPYYFATYGGESPARAGASHASIAPYGPFAASDGKVFLGIQNDREWAAFCALVLLDPARASDPRFLDNPNRVAHRADLHSLIDACFSGLTAAEIVDRLDRAGIANARLRTVAEFAAHPQLAKRDRWREVATPVGPVRAFRPPVESRHTESTLGPVPALGEHTESILAEVSSWARE